MSLGVLRRIGNRLATIPKRRRLGWQHSSHRNERMVQHRKWDAPHLSSGARPEFSIESPSSLVFSIVRSSFLLLLVLLRRDSTSQEFAIQVGTPRRGSTQRINAMYTARNAMNHSQSSMYFVSFLSRQWSVIRLCSYGVMPRVN
jgi:hypothetical protein